MFIVARIAITAACITYVAKAIKDAIKQKKANKIVK